MKYNLIFGHKVPDTDSVCSAIALADLKNKLGDLSKPFVLGHVNTETKYVLDHFDVKEPELLKDVKLQIKDLNYDKIEPIQYKKSINFAYRYMNERNLRTLPITNENNELVGILTMKDIAMSLINISDSSLSATYGNILETLNGKLIVKVDEVITGNIMVGAFYVETVKAMTDINQSTILIIGDRYDVLEYAIEKKAKLIVITGDLSIPENLIESAKQNGVNIIQSPSKTYHTAKNICLAKSIKNIMKTDNIIQFVEDEYVDDCKEEIETSKHSKFPVISKSHQYLGILGRNHMLNPTRKKVILVDHNESAQSVDGLKDAEILEIVDHHKIGDIATSYPINFRNMTVGSSNTIVYQLYKENNIEIDRKVAGLMLSGILSDTLMFKSPTTTPKDKEVVEDLANMLNIDIYEYSMNMFKAGTSLVGKSIKEVFYQDYKEFNSDKIRVGVSQVFTLSIHEIMDEKEKYIELIDKMTEEKQFQLIIMAVTDIINEGSYIFYTSNKAHVVKSIFNIETIEQGIYVPKCVSRKKQIVPGIMENLDIL